MPFALKCPDCRGKFPWDRTADFPQFCPLCRADIGIDTDDTVIHMPSLRSAASKSVDKVYADMEKGSELRMQKGAEMAGCSPEEMSSLKITDIRTGLKEGEIAAVPVNNAVTQAMSQTPGLTGFQANGAEFAAGTRVGPYARAGAKTAMTMTSLHQQNMQALAVSGKRG